ncbi:response regulator [Streptomyces sp. NBC_01451]|uniref:response regulator n=1 Tax=Streptomyces sp. NBC_01451 TaxID=2903872 RepID=UPI002E34C6C8|nr:response regulator [Streptomyces sp. NBC_01451]
MITTLSGTRILVADDQPDVARTFCSSLRAAGAKIQHVADGQAAWDAICSQPFDLMLVDMKMPPEEWGGLWLLEQLANAQNHIPVLVLSGEGGKPQVIKAMRLGAADWVDKDSAAEQLHPACTKLLTEANAAALQNAAEQLPTPLAYRFARYLRATTTDTQVSEGLHTIEAILRFASCIGMAASRPHPIPGLAMSKLHRPSMGTWRDIAFSLGRQAETNATAKRTVQALAPDTPSRTTVDALVKLRNDIFHGRATPKNSDRDTIDWLLRCFAHRATTTLRLGLTVATSMRFDGAAYTVDTLLVRGTATPQPATHHVDRPIVDGTILLVDETDSFPDLTPLFASVTSPAGEVRCVQFDGILDRTDSDGHPVVKYASGDGRDGELLNLPAAITWPAAHQWTTSP